MCDCDCNPPSFFCQRTRKARKPHACTECRRTIQAGEHYEYISGCWEGHLETFRTCAHCYAAGEIVKQVDRAAWEKRRDDVIANMPSWAWQFKYYESPCWCLGEQWSGIDESTGSSRERGKTINRLILAARRQWTIRRGPRKGQLMAVPTLASTNPSETKVTT